MNEIIMFIISFLLGIFVIKVGIDNSNSARYSKEILEELIEIKELIKSKKKEDDPTWPGSGLM